MQYLNGIALDGTNWYQLTDGRAFPSLSRRTAAAAIPGMIGQLTGPLERDPAKFTRTIRCAPAGRAALEALLDSDTLVLSNATMEAVVRIDGEASPTDFVSGDDVWTDYVVPFVIDGVYFRSKNATTSPAAAINAASVDVSVLSGISGKVTDAILRIKAAVTGLRIESGDTYVEFGDAIEGSERLIIDCGKRTAHMVTTDTWTGGTDVTEHLDWGPGLYPLVIAPTWTDPATRAGKLTVKTTTRSGATIEVRAKGAYVSADL